MIRQQVSFFNPALLLLRQLPEYLSEVPPQFPVQHFTPALGDKHYMVFALPLRMA